MSQKYVTAHCSHCKEKHIINLEELCQEQTTVALGQSKKDELIVTCDTCGKKFKVEADCSEYK